MQIQMLQSKIHRATVTDANLNYVGSITIDENLIKAANLKEFQKVEILDVNNGERFATYIIKGSKPHVKGRSQERSHHGGIGICCTIGLTIPEDPAEQRHHDG